MPTTSNYSLPYPSLGATPNVPSDIQALAEAVDSTIAGLITDTGDLSGLAATAGTGWNVDAAEYRIILGLVMQLNVQVSRTGGQVGTIGTGGSHPGNVSPDEDLFTIDDTAKRPTTSVEVYGHATTTGGSVRLKPSGLATLYDLHTDSTIDQGDIISTTFIYLLPS
ncbi:MAG: hypothetical protein ACRDMV_04430 [Streptosporangiales bacterium]